MGWCRAAEKLRLLCSDPQPATNRGLSLIEPTERIETLHFMQVLGRTLRSVYAAWPNTVERRRDDRGVTNAERRKKMREQ